MVHVLSIQQTIKLLQRINLQESKTSVRDESENIQTRPSIPALDHGTPTINGIQRHHGGSYVLGDQTITSNHVHTK